MRRRISGKILPPRNESHKDLYFTSLHCQTMNYPSQTNCYFAGRVGFIKMRANTPIGDSLAATLTGVSSVPPAVSLTAYENWLGMGAYHSRGFVTPISNACENECAG